MDPRSIITPDAFHVSPDLLGLPLASPRRRLGAILLDLVFIGILTVVTRSFALVLGIVVAVALVRAGFRRTAVTGSVFDSTRRLSIGCLGMVVGLVTIGLGSALILDDSASEGVSGADPQGFVIDVQRDPPAGDPIESRDAQAVRDGVTLYSIEQALETYAALRNTGGTDAMDEELIRALEERLATEFASDTLLALEVQIADLGDEARAAQEREGTSGGVLSWLSGILDDLGFGFGWAALYTTVWMSTTNGQTLGKRLLGIRVVKLDGLRINWWIAFERAGGYAAGFATGLLGFAQVYWDPNRQAIHDRIAGTVVVRDGAKLPKDGEAML
jgi:hypothetical protein